MQEIVKATYIKLTLVCSSDKGKSHGGGELPVRQEPRLWWEAVAGTTDKSQESYEKPTEDLQS